MDWDIVIGLEVHVQLNTETKAFCSCKVNYGDSPNTHVCPVCLAYPGALPVLNIELVNSAVKLGLATNCSIRPHSTFARKIIFTPIFPKGIRYPNLMIRSVMKVMLILKWMAKRNASE